MFAKEINRLSVIHQLSKPCFRTMIKKMVQKPNWPTLVGEVSKNLFALILMNKLALILYCNVMREKRNNRRCFNKNKQQLLAYDYATMDDLIKIT